MTSQDFGVELECGGERGVGFVAPALGREPPRHGQTGLGDAGIERQGFLRGRGAVVGDPVDRIGPEQVSLGKCQQRPGLGIFRVDFRRALAQADDGLLSAQVAEIALDPGLPRHQQEVVSLGAVRSAPFDRLLFSGQQPEPQRADDRLGDFVLDGEDVGQVAVVALGPDMIAGGAVDQLRADAQPIAGLADAAFDEVADAQLASDRADVGRLTLEQERGVARRDRQRRDLGQIGGDVLADPVAEIFLLRVAAHVGEGQDADGWPTRRAGVRTVRPPPGAVFTLRDQPVPDLGDRLDLEAAFANAGGDVADARERAVDRVFTDDPSVPATRRQLIASDDRTARAGERDQHLQHPRLDDLVAAAAFDQASRRLDVECAKDERRLVREHYLPWCGEPVVLPLPHRSGVNLLERTE